MTARKKAVVKKATATDKKIKYVMFDEPNWNFNLFSSTDELIKYYEELLKEFSDTSYGDPNDHLKNVLMGHLICDLETKEIVELYMDTPEIRFNLSVGKVKNVNKLKVL